MPRRNTNTPTLSGTHALISGAVCTVILIISIVLFRSLTQHPPEAPSGPPAARSAGLAQTDPPSEATPGNPLQPTREEVTSLQQKLTETKQELTDVRDQLTESQRQMNELLEKISEFEVVSASAEAQNMAVQARAEQVAQDLKTLAAELTGWHTRFTSLMTAEEGKRIVAAGTYLDFFSALSEKSRPSENQLAVWRDQIDKLLEPLKSASTKKNETFVAPKDYVQLIDQIAKEVRQALDDLQQDRALLDVVLRDTAKVDPADMTLNEALARRREEEIRVFSQRVSQARQSALESSGKLLEDAEAQRVAASAAKQKQIIDNERQRLELDTQALKDQAEAAQQSFAAQQAKAKLVREMEADMDEIRNLLRPFIEPGFKQPLDYINFQATLEKGPVSFSKIKGTGALDNTMEALTKLMSIGTSKGNDRPRGGFPVFHYTVPTTKLRDFLEKDPKMREKLQRAQELLNKYGPLLVERGMLSP